MEAVMKYKCVINYSMFKNNKNLMIIALIAIVNALGYGIIIPVLYTYSQKFGLTDFQNGLLFSLFSLCQFIATPVIGRLSDVYGRKPLLVFSIAGTALSFFLMAFAPSAIFLFIARALDGITAGNIPVASAVISDTTKPEDRAKGFGIIGASFGFGFIFGPAISALTFQYGEAVPFIIAGSVSLLATVLTAWLLPETNKHMGVAKKGSVFNFSHLIHSLVDPNVGTTLLLSFVYALAFSMFIYGYQPLSVKMLGLTPVEISMNFTVIGLIGLIAQAVIIPRVMKKVKDTVVFRNALIAEMLTLVGFFLVRSYPMLLIASVFHALSNAFINPLIQTLLSKEVDAHSQGAIQGVNASYMSVGMILGPIVGGLLTSVSTPLPFLVASIATLLCVLLSLKIMAKAHAKAAIL
jgi:MFS family permease